MAFRNVAADPVCRLAQRVIVQMRIARGRGGVGVPQQLADDRKAKTGAGAEACVGMAKVTKASVCPGTWSLPNLIKLD